jgi:hypothetical protein
MKVVAMALAYFAGVVATHAIRQNGNLRIAVEGHGVFVVVAHPSAVGTGEKFVDHGGCRVRRQAAEHGGSTEFRTAGSFITLGGKAAMSGPFASRLAS